MPTDRFIIRFDTNVTAALTALDRLARRITQIEVQLNALGARSAAAARAAFTGINAGAAGASQQVAGLGANVARMPGLFGAWRQGQQNIAAISTVTAGLNKQMSNLAINAQINAGLFNQFGNVAAGRAAVAQLQKLSVMQQLVGQSGAAAASQANSLSQGISRIAPAAGQAGAAVSALDDPFARHIRRIQETIFAYAAFFAAVTAVSKGIDLATTIDRESRRLEAVIGIAGEQSKQFIQGLADTAVNTVTPLEDLISEADRMAAAFLDISDPTERAAASQRALQIAGSLTTVTQRGVADETQNLIAIMKQFGFSADELGNAMGKVVVAGGNSSTVISALVDALATSGRAAQAAGVDFDTLTALLSRFIIQTGKSGSEVGNTFRTLFARFTDPDVIDGVNEITNGLLRMRDSLGNIRDPISVMLELNALLEAGKINATQFSDVLDTIGPPLNPAAKSDLIIITKLLADIGPEVEKISAASEDSLDQLVNKINSALGPQFLKFIEEVKRGFIDLFAPQIIEVGSGVLNVLRTIRDILAEIPAPILVAIAKFSAFFAAIRIGGFVIRGLIALLGFGGLGKAATTAAAGMTSLATATAVTGTATISYAGAAGTATGATVTFSTAMAGAAGGATLFSRAVGVLGGALSGLYLVMARLWPILLAFAAIEIGTHLLDEGGKIDVLTEKLGLTESAAQAVVSGIENIDRKDIVGAHIVGRPTRGTTAEEIPPELASRFGVHRQVSRGPFGRGGTGLSLEQQLTNVENLSEAMATLDKTHELTTAAQKKMSDAVKEANQSITGSVLSVQELISVGQGLADSTADQETEYDKLQQAVDDYIASLQEMTAAEQIAQESQALRVGLDKEVADALEHLSDRQRDGKISSEEYAAGLEDVLKAADLAAQVVAAASDELKKVPELAGAAADSNDALAEAIFNMIVKSTDQLPLIDQLIGRIVAIAGAAAAAAATAAANPIIVRTFIAKPVRVNGTLAGGGIPEGAGDPGLGRPSGSILRQAVTSVSSNVADVSRQIQSVINSLIKAITGGTSAIGGFGGGGGSAAGRGSAARQANVLDIGDLSPSQINKVIQIATALRDKIPGEKAASADAVVALIKDAKFLRTVRGIDDRLLRIAIEELTQQMETANRLAQQNSPLRNLTVNAGPLSALISQPTAFGVAGSLASGNGLNFNPEQGNFVINVPVELKGLDPAKLQELIYNIISKAIRDSLRI